MAEEIPPRVVQFLRDDIDSVRQLETLLLLRGAAARAWHPEEVSRELRSSPTWAAEQLERLHACGLLEIAPSQEGEPAYRYAPSSSATASTVDAVAEAFVRRKNTVIKLIFGGEADPVQSLSDAFRFRRDR